ncbi:7078_t:CDS:2 [Racocetra fulgida]|uniref:7078_t:CDS:1 n=1 Tax=Racocetra fulgida TaxID=60492 RepID=A0A9N8W7T6_9GLOM|nr:7078_t:CDS:2 [Racocetra fulgida]
MSQVLEFNELEENNLKLDKENSTNHVENNDSKLNKENFANQVATNDSTLINEESGHEDVSNRNEVLDNDQIHTELSKIQFVKDRGKYQGLIGAVFIIASITSPIIGGLFADNDHLVGAVFGLGIVAAVFASGFSDQIKITAAVPQALKNYHNLPEIFKLGTKKRLVSSLSVSFRTGIAFGLLLVISAVFIKDEKNTKAKEKKAKTEENEAV